MNNRKGMSISIVILVITFLILAATCLFAFSIRAKRISSTLEFSSLVEIYVIEDLLNYNVNKIMEKSSASTEDDFIVKFKQELGAYKSGGDYLPYQLNQVESQLTSENIEITEDKILLTLNFKIQGDASEDVDVSYKYKKVFESELLNEEES